MRSPIAASALRAGAAAAVLALTVVPAAQAQTTLQVSYPGDGALSCDQIQAEIIRMDGVMGVSSNAIAGAEGAARVADVGASVGINAALYSGALGRMPGLGMFANAASGAAKANAAAKAKREADQIQVAQQRRAVMSGLYQGKSCGAPSATTAATVAAASAPSLLGLTTDLGLRATASPTAEVVRDLKAGASVYPTGARNGVWIEVDDETGARGWISSAFTQPR